jgi:hypothetical protein
MRVWTKKKLTWHVLIAELSNTAIILDVDNNSDFFFWKDGFWTQCLVLARQAYSDYSFHMILWVLVSICSHHNLWEIWFMYFKKSRLDTGQPGLSVLGAAHLLACISGVHYNGHNYPVPFTFRFIYIFFLIIGNL